MLQTEKNTVIPQKLDKKILSRSHFEITLIRILEDIAHSDYFEEKQKMANDFMIYAMNFNEYQLRNFTESDIYSLIMDEKELNFDLINDILNKSKILSIQKHSQENIDKIV